MVPSKTFMVFLVQVTDSGIENVIVKCSYMFSTYVSEVLLRMCYSEIVIK